MEVDLTLMTGGFVQGAQRAKESVVGLRSRINSLGTKMLNVNKLTLAQGAAYAFAAKKAFDFASAVEETQSKFDTVFGSESGAVQNAIDQISALAGLSNRAAQDITATSGAIVQGFGLSAQASADLAVQITELAGDLASFNNIPVAETARAIQAGLTGEMESLKRLGIAVLDADVKQKALTMTGKALASELTTQEVVVARLALITERAGVQVGDMARTQDTAAAKARILKAEFITMAEDMSRLLLPVFEFVLDAVLGFIRGIQQAGIEVAIWLAELKVLKEQLFGTEESLLAAQMELNNMGVAALETTMELLGLGEAVGFYTSRQLESTVAVQEGTTEVRTFGDTARDVQITTSGLSIDVVDLAGNMEMLAQTTGFAADETDRLREAQQRLSAIRQGLGFLSFIPGVGQIASIASTALSGVGAIGSIANAFGGQQVAQSAGPQAVVVNVPEARDPITIARDQQWLRALSESNRNLAAQGAF